QLVIVITHLNMLIRVLYLCILNLGIHGIAGHLSSFEESNADLEPSLDLEVNLHESSDLESAVIDHQYDIKSNSDKKNYCPARGLIFPCYCTHEYDFMDLHCQYVGSEEALWNVFQNSTYFERKNFREFRMIKNKHVKVLEAGVFNDVTFTDFLMIASVLEEIEVGALDASFDTAKQLLVFNNKISNFPFESLKNFQNLTHLDLGYNPIPKIPVDAFQGLTSLEFLNLGHTTSNIQIGTFKNLTSLEILAVTQNNLTHIPSTFFHTSSPKLKIVELWENGVESVDPDAFDLTEGMYIGATRNSIHLIEEATWKPLLQSIRIPLLRMTQLKCYGKRASFLRSTVL
ncbi:unnamed protein product, partial [Meganyctiphanes norvegica]